MKSQVNFVYDIEDDPVDELKHWLFLENVRLNQQRQQLEYDLEELDRMKEKLEKLGYKVDIGLGNLNTRISLAVYDEKTDRYLVGVELDKDTVATSSVMERDVYKPLFLQQRGWVLLRIWCRDWWLYPQKVIKAIAAAAEKNRVR